MQLRGPSSSPVFSNRASSNLFQFPNLKTNIRGKNLGSNKGAKDAVDEYLGHQEDGFCFTGISKLKKKNIGKSALRQREIILIDYGTITALGLPKIQKLRPFLSSLIRVKSEQCKLRIRTLWSGLSLLIIKHWTLLQRQHLFPKTLPVKWFFYCKEYLMCRLIC